jgi:uncharacterized membrane protein
MIRRLSLAALIVASANSVWACPMCKLALETDDPQPRAYMISILFMMGMIFTMFGLVGALVLWISRQERTRLVNAGYSHLFENAVTEQLTPEAG